MSCIQPPTKPRIESIRNNYYLHTSLEMTHHGSPTGVYNDDLLLDRTAAGKPARLLRSVTTRAQIGLMAGHCFSRVVLM